MFLIRSGVAVTLLFLGATAALAGDLPFCDSKSVVTGFITIGDTYTAQAGLPSSSPFLLQCAAGTRILYTYQAAPPANGDARWQVDPFTGAVSLSGTTAEGITTAIVTVLCGVSTNPLCRRQYIVGSAPRLTAAPTTLAPPTPVPTTTTSAPPTIAPVTLAPGAIAKCLPVYGYDLAAGVDNTASLADVEFASTCAAGETAEYALLSQTTAPGSAVALDVGTGVFTYRAPTTARIDRFSFKLRCNGVDKCMATAYIAISVQPFTAAPTPVPTTPILTCDPVFYQIRQNPAAPTAGLPFDLRASLSTVCDGAFDASVLQPPVGTSNFSMQSSGAFIYAPMQVSDWDNFTFAVNCAPSNGRKWTCQGVAHILTLPAGATLAPPSPPPSTIPSDYVGDRLTCSGTCNDRAWISAHFSADRWDTTPDVYTRVDGRPVAYIRASMESGQLRIDAAGDIGNMAVRFPTFEPIATQSELLTSKIIGSIPVSFKASCLDNQAPYGAGEQVWWWDNSSSLDGVVGDDYKSGMCYYQKFGGKHILCDTFREGTCNYAPMLQPVAPWTVAINDCDTMWTATLDRPALLQLQKSNGDPVFSRDWSTRYASIQQRREVVVVSADVFSEAVKPRSWVQPRVGFLTTAQSTRVSVVLEEIIVARINGVRVVADNGTAIPSPTTPSSWVAGNVDRFAYLGADGVSIWAGYNLLLFPTTTADVAPMVTGLRISQVVFANLTAAMCGAQCAGKSMACGIDGALSCTVDSTALQVQLGPASTVPCPQTKPYAPAGVAGISDTTCDPASLTNAARALNVTIRVRLGLSPGNGTAGMLYLPDGMLRLTLVERVTPPNSNLFEDREEDLDVTLTSTLANVADDYVPPVTAAPSLAPGQTVGPTSPPAPADVEVTLCRGNLWPTNPLLDSNSDDVPPMKERCIAMNERTVGPQDFITLVFTANRAASVRRQAADATDAPPDTMPPIPGDPVELQFVTATAHTTDGTDWTLPFLLVNNSLVSMTDASRQRALLPSCSKIASPRVIAPNIVGFTPGLICPSSKALCEIVVEAGVRVPSTGAVQVTRYNFIVDPALTTQVRTGMNPSADLFLRVMYRENGGRPKGPPKPDASHFALGVSLVLAAAVFFLGAVAIYSSQDGRAVVSEHASVLNKYMKKATGVDLAASSKKLMGRRAWRSGAASPPPTRGADGAATAGSPTEMTSRSPVTRSLAAPNVRVPKVIVTPSSPPNN